MNKLINGNCLEVMPTLESQSIDLILTDLPYGTTRNKWDIIIPLAPMWSEFNRLIKPNGAIVLTAAQPFTSMLIMSNQKMFRYDLIWQKTIASGQLNVNRQPLRKHESILVFYTKQPTYNQQMSEGEPYIIHRKANFEGPSYNNQKPSSKINDGYRHPTSIITISNPRIKGGHPTQKPVELFEYLILTYTNSGDVVLDPCIGSGTTAIACLNTNRQYIGIEKSAKYYKMTQERIDKYEYPTA